ncbi:Indoleamine 2,3-dioxygenase [Gymnopus androsaceus JB14]|uniref:Indoleamine 2,3-dioxygenase n=1 Tax=Gymnopus androsaceus JB14 TaxID=1447944 RepID=A0A6A4IHP8_9AGAR|nr:Indoleamine 2,3-dioxygenase [Gymnopus androsaceus JB14]
MDYTVPTSGLDSSHFLSLPRPSITLATSSDTPIVDTTTLAAHDFDVDPRTGFMPPQPPVERLPNDYSQWEELLQDACTERLTGLGQNRRAHRRGVSAFRFYPLLQLLKSEVLIRRAHHVLAWIMHFYIHTQPLSSSDIRIPPPITLPLLQICRELQLPPVLTYSDDVLYNWGLINPDASGTIDPQNLWVLTSFTSTPSESHFYLTSARIELIGVRALALMESTLGELFAGDDIALRRITRYLNELGGGTAADKSNSASSRGIIGEMELELNNMTAGCDPRVFYEEIRPWFRGVDSGERRWIFEGLELDEMLEEPKELSGPSAGQSSIIHALDVFLGVEQYSHGSAGTESQSEKPTFLSRMQLYMPRHHRNFLSHLQNNRRSLRTMVLDTCAAAAYSDIDPSDARNLLEAYNSAVMALKKLRDSHIVIVTLYIISPARRAAQEKREREREAIQGLESRQEEAPLKGTGGTDLAKFLKGVRDGTRDAVIRSGSLEN